MNRLKTVGLRRHRVRIVNDYANTSPQKRKRWRNCFSLFIRTQVEFLDLKKLGGKSRETVPFMKTMLTWCLMAARLLVWCWWRMVSMFCTTSSRSLTSTGYSILTYTPCSEDLYNIVIFSASMPSWRECQAETYTSCCTTKPGVPNPSSSTVLRCDCIK